MNLLRNIFTAALVALPLTTFAVMTAEASPRGHGDRGGYSEHRGYNQHGRGFGRSHQSFKRKAWFSRMHASRRHGGWKARAH